MTTIIKGNIINETKDLYMLNKVTIIRHNGSKEYWENYSIPKCYITEITN